jgi:hypothetical protein
MIDTEKIYLAVCIFVENYQILAWNLPNHHHKIGLVYRRIEIDTPVVYLLKLFDIEDVPLNQYNNLANWDHKLLNLIATV